MTIDSFRGEYAFLSNFWPEPVCGFPTAEHFFQSRKARKAEDIETIRLAPTPASAKAIGRRIELRSDWEAVKIPAMRAVLEQKFAAGTALADRLLATGCALLVEGNTWGDTFWGVSLGRGFNWLGHLLMARRAELHG